MGFSPSGVPPLLLIFTLACLTAWRLSVVFLNFPRRQDVDAAEQLSLHRTNNYLLGVGYGSAALLLIFYFACERAVCHRSKEHESSYQVFLTVLVVLVSAAVSAIERLYKMPDDVTMNVAGLLVFLMTVVALRIARVVAEPKVFDNVFCQDCNSSRLAEIQFARDARASRISAELTASVSELLNLQSGDLSGVPEGAFNMFVLVFLMFVQIHVHDHAVRHLVDHAHIVALAFSLLLVAHLWSAVRRFRHISPERDHLHNTVVAMVEEAARRNDKAFVAKVLHRISVGSLLEVSWQKTRMELMQRAVSQGVLDVVAKAILIDAYQKRGLAAYRRQSDVRHLLLDTRGLELTELKNLIDSGNDYHNLNKLMDSITHFDLRRDILNHISKEGNYVRGSNGGKAIGTKVLSDVDDTLYSSGGKFPAGCDKAYPKHVVYPGCLKLFEVLDLGARSSTSSPDGSCNLVFLSARPHIYKAVAEDQSYQLFRQLARDDRMHSFPTLLPGNLVYALLALMLYPFMKTKAWKWVGQYKFYTSKTFAALYPEYDFVFCGDNGQGDLLAGELMLEENRCESESESDRELTVAHAGGRTLCVLIHEVLPCGSELANEPAAVRGDCWREEMCRRGLIFHRSYVGAALGVFQRGIISVEGLEAVVRTAVEDFAWSVAAFPEFTRWEDAAQALRDDIQAANAMLVANGRPEVNEDFHRAIRLAAKEAREAKRRRRRRRTKTRLAFARSTSCRFCMDSATDDLSDEDKDSSDSGSTVSRPLVP